MAGTVHVIDDDPLFRAALELHLRKAGYKVALYLSAEHLLDHFPHDESEPSCIIVDVRLPGMSGPDLQKRIVDRGSTLRILFVTGYPDTSATVNTIKAGAEDFLIKPINFEQLLRAVERAMGSHQTLREVNAKSDGHRARLSKLTPRERQVFDLVVRGKQNKQIAHELGATERTIKAHRHQVMEKMGARSIAELVSAAERLGVLGDG